MAVPSRHVDLLLRVAERRTEDAEILAAATNYGGAMYLAHYDVECRFKALLIACVPRSQEQDCFDRFRTAAAHDLLWLRDRYLALNPPPIAVVVTRAITAINRRGYALRYDPRKGAAREWRSYRASQKVIADWINPKVLA